MKESFFSLIKKWPFWIGLQISLLALLTLIGTIRAGNSFHALFTRYEEGLVNILATILGFPSGIYFLFHPQGSPSGLLGIFFAWVVPALYYPTFLFLVWYITKEKENWKWIAVGLLAFLLLSFGGCARVISLPLVIT